MDLTEWVVEGGNEVLCRVGKGGKGMSLTSNFCRGPKTLFLVDSRENKVLYFKGPIEENDVRNRFNDEDFKRYICWYRNEGRPKSLFPWPTFLLQIPRLPVQRRWRGRRRRRRGPLLTSPCSAPPSETPEAFQGPSVHLLKLHFFGKRRVALVAQIFLKAFFRLFALSPCLQVISLFFFT